MKDNYKICVIDKYEYKLFRSKRKTIELSINKNLDIIVRAPILMSMNNIEIFIRKNIPWIEKNLVKVKNKQANSQYHELSEDEINRLKAIAKEILPKKVEYYQNIMNVKPTSIKITQAKTRWGSCSSKNGLCFSCRLMQMPEPFIDYVVVHELAHIRVKNHSQAFYNEIEKYMPDYKERIKLIK